jgi:uncharacterized repeat protein (TIGR01451 family)
MLIRKLVIALLVLGVAGVTGAVLAQGDADQQKSQPPKTLFERLDDFSKSIFGGRTSEKAKTKDAGASKTDSRSSARKSASSPSQDDVKTSSPSTARAGSVLAGTDSSQAKSADKSAGSKSAVSDSDVMPESAPPAVTRSADGTPKPVRRPVASKSLLDESDPPEPAQKQAPVGQTHKFVGVPSGIMGELAESGPSKSGVRPLHERLAAVRQSVFVADPKPEPQPQPDLQPAPTSDAMADTSPKDLDAEVAKLAGRPIAAQRVTPAASDEKTVSAEPVLGPASDAPAVAERAVIAVEKTPAVAERAVIVAEKTPAVAEKAATAVEKAPAVAEKAVVPAEKVPAAAKSDNDSMLFARKGPLLSIETTGPRRITVGKESAYEVSVVNSGEVAAEDLVVFVTLPESAEVVGAEPSVGATQAFASQQPAGTVQWAIKRLDPRARERLMLKIIARQSRPFDLAVRWESKPVASQAMIEVQEAKLLLQLEGPREVLYGKKEMFHLKLTNTGNGAAENVAIMLMPMGTGENVPASHKIGTLAAGAEKVLDVELTARQAGNLAIQVEARADGAHAELSESVLVRRAGLKVDIEGPKVQFVGAVATYVIRVRNTGSAQARNVSLSITLPPGAKYLSGIDGARLDAAGNKLDWTLDSINPEVEQSVAMKCSLTGAGVNRVQINATADSDLTATTGTVTQVDAVANLVMDVKNPEGPVPVGEEATYEVRLRNRGTKAAEGVEVFVYLSSGIEPTAAEGGPNQLGVGEVVFNPIASLPAGAETILKVRARAETGGNHIFRAEAHCKAPGARLVSEVTNLYYTESTGDQKTAEDETTASDGVRTVNRAIRIEQTPAPPRK